MKFMKRGLAVLLAVLLAVSPLSVLAQEMPVQGDAGNSGNQLAGAGETGGLESTEAGNGLAEAGKQLAETGNESAEAGNQLAETGSGLAETGNGLAEIGSQPAEGGGTAPQESVGDDAVQPVSAMQEDSLVIGAREEVQFNTGNHVYKVVNATASGNVVGDGCFGEDGSYTINIPEANPFFPYEVQFTYKGETVNKWFMAPDDSVEVGEHTFYVSAYFDNTAVTQMSLDVAGDRVVVYPEEKEFTDDGDGGDCAFVYAAFGRKETAGGFPVLYTGGNVICIHRFHFCGK